MYEHLLAGEKSLRFIRRSSILYRAIAETSDQISSGGFMRGLRVRENWNNFVVDNWEIPLHIEKWYLVFWLSVSYRLLSREDYLNYNNVKNIMLRR